MAQKQQQQPGIPNDNDYIAVTKMDKTQHILALVEFRGQWYRLEDSILLAARSMQFFDTVVLRKTDNTWEIIKDRQGNRKGNHAFLDLLKMQLFADGKTLYDLPRYYEDLGKFPDGPLNLYMDDDGNLVAKSAIEIISSEQ